MLDGCVPWPEELAGRYREAGFWRGETLASLGADIAHRDPERVALVHPARSVTYGELDDRVTRLAAGLLDAGLNPGDRIVVALPNDPDFVFVALAAFRMGAVPVLALPSHRRSEIEHLCRRTDAAALVIPDTQRGYDFRTMAEQMRASSTALAHVLVAGSPGPFTALADVSGAPRPLPEPDPSEVAFFLLSGGTTGMPKLIPRTHDDYAYQLRCTAEVVSADERSVYLAALPVAHNAALGCPGLLGTLRLGGRVVLAPSPSPDDVFELIERERATLTTVMPTFLVLWSHAPQAEHADLSSLLVEVGGAGLDPATARDAQRRLGCTLTHWFGMAEGVLCCTRAADGIEAAATGQGQPICPADELRVVDAADRPCAPGAEGELLVRGPMTIRGYYDEAAHNRTAFTADGFLRTGDLVRMDDTGAIAVTGRLKDVINRGGEKISTGEVEEHLLAHSAIVDAALVAMPDPLLGERACACVAAADPSPSLAEVRRFLVERGVADFKLPDRLEVMSHLPRTTLGKPDKAALRARVVAVLQATAAV